MTLFIQSKCKSQGLRARYAENDRVRFTYNSIWEGLLFSLNPPQEVFIALIPASSRFELRQFQN